MRRSPEISFIERFERASRMRAEFKDLAQEMGVTPGYHRVPRHIQARDRMMAVVTS